MIVNIHEAKTNLSRLLERVAAGEEIIVARAGKPIARIVPLSRPRPRTPGIAAGELTEAFFEPLPADELASWKQ